MTLASGNARMANRMKHTMQGVTHIQPPHFHLNIGDGNRAMHASNGKWANSKQVLRFAKYVEKKQSKLTKETTLIQIIWRGFPFLKHL